MDTVPAIEDQLHALQPICRQLFVSKAIAFNVAREHLRLCFLIFTDLLVAQLVGTELSQPIPCVLR